MKMTQEFFDELRKRMEVPRQTVPAARMNATVIEALRLMRDTTQSQQQYDRAVEALRQMGVRDE